MKLICVLNLALICFRKRERIPKWSLWRLSKYGKRIGSRNWEMPVLKRGPRNFARKAKRKPAIGPQIHSDTPTSKEIHAAILGGSMSVHICALAFEGLSIPSTIFDTGKHGLGLRITTRDVHTKDKLSLIFKHAGQCFTISGREFRKLVDTWVNAGAVKGRKGVVRTL